MKEWTLSEDLLNKLVEGLGRSPWFKKLQREQLETIIKVSEILGVDADETIVEAGAPSDAFFLLLKGEITIESEDRNRGRTVELGRIKAPFVFGEVGLLLEHARTATVVATSESLLMRLSREAFFKLFHSIEEFRTAVTRGLAGRLAAVSAMTLPDEEIQSPDFDPETSRLLPMSFIERYQLLPLSLKGETLRVGFLDSPTPPVLSALRERIPSLSFEPVRIGRADFERILEEIRPRHVGRTTSVLAVSAGEKLTGLVQRVIAEGASDLHLPPQRRPHWRLDGDLLPIEEEEPLGREEALELMRPVMHQRNLEEFEEKWDSDFAIGLEDIGRFRVNVYRTSLGVNAALRPIPTHIRTLEELGMPAVLKKLALLPNGLIVIAGATGSGKSTTLAAMIDSINRSRRCHILTLEDPIEFIHEEDLAILDQREVGLHVSSFARGLRAGLREDPDIILVGEMRDPETVALALEAANTGHLVLTTLHTNSAMTTIERIVDMFPGDARSEVRTTLSEVLRGVACQTLVKRRDAGRLAAMEILVATPAVANLIREDKSQQLANAMVSGAREGSRLLNDSLAALVRERKVLKDEALRSTANPEDLLRRLQRPRPEEAQA